MPFKDKYKHDKIEPGEPGYIKGEEDVATAPMRYWWERKQIMFTLLPGAISNGASIPTIVPDIIISDHGKIDKPAAAHDDQYHAYLDIPALEREVWEKKHAHWTKADADLMFHDGMRDEGMHWLRYKLAYAAVRGNFIAAYKWGRNSE